MKVTYFLAKLWSVALAALTLGIVAFLLEISLGKLGVTQDLIILAIVTAASLLVYSVALFLLDKELFIGIVRLLDQLRSADRRLPDREPLTFAKDTAAIAVDRSAPASAIAHEKTRRPFRSRDSKRGIFAVNLNNTYRRT